MATALRFYVSDLKAGRRYHIHHGVIEKAQGSAPNDPSTFVLRDHFAIATEGKSLKERMEDLARWCRENLVFDESSEIKLSGPDSLHEAYTKHCSLMGDPPTTKQAVACAAERFVWDHTKRHTCARHTDEGKVLSGLRLRGALPTRVALATASESREARKKSVFRWLRDCTVVDESAETKLTGPNSLLGAYQEHCKSSGDPPASHQAFSIWLEEHQRHELKRYPHRRHTDAGVMALCIKLGNPAPAHK